jgi:hypothetical protein
MKFLSTTVLLALVSRSVPFSIPSRRMQTAPKSTAADNPIEITEKMTPEAIEFQNRLADKKDALFIAQTAPSVRVALPEEFGLEPGRSIVFHQQGAFLQETINLSHRPKCEQVRFLLV